MARPRFIYLPGYYCDIGEHVFRTEKYELLHRKLLMEGLAKENDFLPPSRATREQLELVHTPEYLDDLMSGQHTRRTLASEMPLSRDIVNAFVLGAGGSILACRTALEQSTGTMNLAGGFHHAFADRAEGFCYINDVAVAIKTMETEGLLDTAFICDCDLHQGNGTARIFEDDRDVFTFSIHQQNLYPPKQNSDMDVPLPDMCGGDRYLRELRTHLLPALDRHTPDLVLYVAGADPYEKDSLGSLRLTLDDLRARDELVMKECADRGIPFAVVLAGGYAPEVNDTVTIHFGTAEVLVETCHAF